MYFNKKFLPNNIIQIGPNSYPKLFPSFQTYATQSIYSEIQIEIKYLYIKKQHHIHSKLLSKKPEGHILRIYLKKIWTWHSKLKIKMKMC